MNTHFSINRFATANVIAVLAVLALPVCLLKAQSAPSARSTEFTSRDVSSEMSVGPTVNVRQLASSPSQEGTSSANEMAPFRFPRLNPPVQDEGPVTDVAATTTLDTSIAGHSFFRGFTGLTHKDQRLARNGNQFSVEPPDQGLAVGNGFVVEAINTAFNVYDTNGNQLLVSPLALTELFGLPASINRTTGKFGVFAGDPSCLFDPETQRWFVLAFAALNDSQGNPLRQSRLFLAVSQTSDPTGAFNNFVFNTTGTTNPDGFGARIPDFPHFAVDHFGLFISSNEFKINPNGSFDGFLDAAILAISKDALLTGTGGGLPRRAERFELPFQTGFEFTVFPAVTPPGSGPVLANNGTQFFVSSPFIKNNENQLAVWALTNTGSLSTPSPDLHLKVTVVNTRTFHFPSLTVVQKNGFHPLGKSLGEPVETLDPGDFRIISATLVNGRLWCTLNSMMKDANGNQVEAPTFFALVPQISGGKLSASVATQGVLSLTGVDLMYPAIAVNAQGNGAIVFTLVSPDNFPSSAFAAVSGDSVGPIRISAAGQLPEDGFTGYPEFGGSGVARWGDYSAAAVNNLDNTIWMATEYIDNLPRTTFANWDTFITRFQP
jgi:hypothetical protein